MKKQHKIIVIKAAVLVFVALATVFLYGFLIGGSSGIWFMLIEFIILFIVMCFFVTKTDRKELAGIFTKNIILCLLISITSTLAYDGINMLQVKETKIYNSSVTGNYGKGGGTVCFLDEDGEEQFAELHEYFAINADYFEEGEKIIVTEKTGLFDAPFFSIEEAEK